MDPSTSLPHSFSVHQARSVGLTPHRLRTMIARGQLTRIRRGLYARTTLPPPELRRRAHLAAVRAELEVRGPGFAASHLSAAAALDLPLPLGDLTTVHLTAVEAFQRTRRSPGVIVHHCDSIPTLTAMLDGLLVTAPARTVADCLRCFAPRVSVPIADAAVRAGWADLSEVAQVVDAQVCWRGHSRAVAVLPLVDGRRESWLESYASVCFCEWGVLLPEPQVVVLDGSGRFVARCDGGWLEDATMLELDGRSKYRLPTDGVIDGWAALDREKARGDSLGNLGLERVRFGLVDLLRGPAGVVDVIESRRAAGARSRSPGRSG